jgi:hypothetical protein
MRVIFKLFKIFGIKILLEVNYINNFNVLIISHIMKICRITCNTYNEPYSVILSV